MELIKKSDARLFGWQTRLLKRGQALPVVAVE
jgi:hypothetical protein